MLGNDELKQFDDLIGRRVVKFFNVIMFLYNLSWYIFQVFEIDMVGYMQFLLNFKVLFICIINFIIFYYFGLMNFLYLCN